VRFAIPLGVIDVVFARIRLFSGSGPVTLHHTIRCPSVERSVGVADALTDMIKNLFINFNPIHLSVRSRDKTVQRYVHECNYTSHIVLLLFIVRRLLVYLHNDRNRMRDSKHPPRRNCSPIIVTRDHIPSRYGRCYSRIIFVAVVDAPFETCT
jgi:hypothetical protein